MGAEDLRSLAADWGGRPVRCADAPGRPPRRLPHDRRPGQRLFACTTLQAGTKAADGGRRWRFGGPGRRHGGRGWSRRRRGRDRGGAGTGVDRGRRRRGRRRGLVPGRTRRGCRAVGSSRSALRGIDRGGARLPVAGPPGEGDDQADGHHGRHARSRQSAPRVPHPGPPSAPRMLRSRQRHPARLQGGGRLRLEQRRGEGHRHDGEEAFGRQYLVAAAQASQPPA